MFKSEIKTWVRICIFNLMIVAVLGSLMRFKIAFEFPFFVQKNLLHSHSHFALFGWISFILMILIANNLGILFLKKLPSNSELFLLVLLYALTVCLYHLHFRVTDFFQFSFQLYLYSCHLHLVDYIIKQPGVSKIQLVENGF